MGGGDRPGIGNRPERPSQLPSRPSIADRQNNLNDRFGDRNNFRDNNINIDRGDINNRWENHHGDWDNRWHDRYPHHGGWYHGHCNWGWHPGYMWENYPVLTAFGVTSWAINRWNWSSGYYPYENPYATSTVIDQSSQYYDYSQPIETVQDDSEAAIPPPEEVLTAFDRATQEFNADQFQTALNSVNEALKQSPNDAAMHEFRALCLFAIGRYDEAAATLYAVLGVGPGWDWTTMIGLYSSSNVYTEQLRKLEGFVKSNPESASSRFVLAYHYITHGHEANAVKQLTQVVKLQPNDTLARDLLLGIAPDADVPKPEVVQPPKPTEKVNADAIEGTWTAQRSGGDKFTMDLNDGGKFTWSYEGGGKKQDVTGVWAVDDDGILALDMGDGNTIVAQLDPQGSSELDFYVVGDSQSPDPLKFKK